MSSNPYIAGNSVGKTSAFVGRDDIVNHVLRVINYPHLNSIVLYGQRRIGKTSILDSLQKQLSQKETFIPVFFDLQDKTTWTLEKILENLVESIQDKIPQPFQIPFPAIEKPIQKAFKDWLKQLLEKLPNTVSLILLLDEFDALADPQGKLINAEIFPYFKQLFEIDTQRLNFVFVIGRNINSLESIASSLFKGTNNLRVSLLNKADTTQLIRLSETNKSLQWSAMAIDKIYALTNGHAYLTQQLCFHIWENAYDKEPDSIPEIFECDVEEAIQATLSASQNMMEWLWDGLPPSERFIAAAIASLGNRLVQEDELREVLHQSGVRMIIRELEEAPKLLSEWDLLEKTEAGYHFKVELLRQWICKNKTLARIQEELDKIEPIADSLYNAAKGFYQTGAFERADMLLKQAIAVNPNHTQATLLLADVCIVRNDVNLNTLQMLEALYVKQPNQTRATLIKFLSFLVSKSDNTGKLSLYQRIHELDSYMQPAKDIIQFKERLIALEKKISLSKFAYKFLEQPINSIKASFYETLEPKYNELKEIEENYEKRSKRDEAFYAYLHKDWKKALPLLEELTIFYPNDKDVSVRLNVTKKAMFEKETQNIVEQYGFLEGILICDIKSNYSNILHSFMKKYKINVDKVGLAIVKKEKEDKLDFSFFLENFNVLVFLRYLPKNIFDDSLIVAYLTYEKESASINEEIDEIHQKVIMLMKDTNYVSSLRYF